LCHWLCLGNSLEQSVVRSCRSSLVDGYRVAAVSRPCRLAKFTANKTSTIQHSLDLSMTLKLLFICYWCKCIIVSHVVSFPSLTKKSTTQPVHPRSPAQESCMQQTCAYLAKRSKYNWLQNRGTFLHVSLTIRYLTLRRANNVTMQFHKDSENGHFYSRSGHPPGNQMKVKTISSHVLRGTLM